MTREKVIKKLKWFKEYNEEDYCGGDRIQDEYGDWYYRVTEQDFEAFDVAIKALEQEPILDKIRAEIADLADSDAYGDYQQGFNFGLMKAAQIIEQYKAESEG